MPPPSGGVLAGRPSFRGLYLAPCGGALDEDKAARVAKEIESWSAKMAKAGLVKATVKRGDPPVDPSTAGDPAAYTAENIRRRAALRAAPRVTD
ncbi:hypothetical protein DIPPA_63885, partial [Diplonema papillatum]